MIHILRLGHRIQRDKRLTTHICLTARAFGADKIIVTGEKDKNLIKTVEEVTSNWGGNFKIEYSKNWRQTLLEYRKKKEEKDWIIIHLTMYGINIPDILPEIIGTEIIDNSKDKSTERIENKNMKNKNFLIIIGGAKVPGEVYELSDYNIAITNQPHSEVSALAILLDRLMNGRELNPSETKFDNAKIKIIPSKKTKHIERLK